MIRILVALILSVVLAAYFSSKALNKQLAPQLDINFNIVVNLKNNTSRELGAIDLFYKLPLELISILNHKDSDIEGKSLDGIRIPITNIYSAQAITVKDSSSLRIHYNADEPSQVNQELEPFKIELLDDLTTQRELELFNKLRLSYDFVRVVSGIKVEFDVIQSAKCWIQYKSEENSNWMTVTSDNNVIIPFQVISNIEDISDEFCQNQLVDVWGLDINSIQYSITRT